MFQHSLLNILFPGFVAKAEEVECIRVFEGLDRQIRIGRREGCGKVCRRLALPAVYRGFDLEGEDVSRLSVENGLLQIPQAVGVVLYLVD